MWSRDGGIFLPFIASPRFGTAVGLISTSPVLEAPLGFVCGNDSPRISGAQLESCRDAAAMRVRSTAAGQALRVPNRSPGAAAFAVLVRELGKEWVLFDNGTAVPLDESSVPLRSAEEFAGCFVNYPFHRLKSDPHCDLMACYLRMEALPAGFRGKALRATRQLLGAGYPVPGCNSDRYTFVSGAVGITWLVPCADALLGYSQRPATAEEMAILGDGAPNIPTVADPRIDELLVSAPLTVVEVAFPENRPPPKTICAALDGYGIEGRRLDCMFPAAAGLISPEGAVIYF